MSVTVWKKIDHTKLISMVLNKYNYDQTKGILESKSDEEHRIVSLASEINNLCGKLKLSSQSKDKGKGTPPKFKDGTKTNKKTKNKKNTLYKSIQKSDESCRENPPKNGEPLAKMVVVKYFQWCIHHMPWENHSSEDCRLFQKRQEEKNQSANNSITSKPVTSSSQVSINYLAACTSAAQDE